MSDLKFPIKAQILCEILTNHGYNARIVGGYIRDIMQDLAPCEIDMATDTSPDIILSICKQHNIKSIPTGIKHGTITVIINGTEIEITTLRQDIKCNGRHAEVVFTNNWEEDAKRRDFTINAMYLDSNLKLYDFFNGQQDLNNNIIRFIGDPEARIHEDYLRIMRYFRFLGYFNSLNLHQESFNAAIKLAENLYKISSERIRSELLKIFSSKWTETPIRLMLENDIFKTIGLNFSQIDTDQIYFGTDPLVNLSIIMRQSNIDDIGVLKRLKFSKAEQKLVSELLQSKLDNSFKYLIENIILGIDITHGVDKMINQVGLDICLKLFEMYYGIYIKLFINDNYNEYLKKSIAIINSVIPTVCPITALDIINLGYIGNSIGIKLRYAKQLWIESNCILDKKSLIKLINN